MTKDQINIDLFNQIKKLEKERDQLKEALKKAWLILDDMEDDKADEWQNKWESVMPWHDLS